mgnify:FL=1
MLKNEENFSSNEHSFGGYLNNTNNKRNKLKFVTIILVFLLIVIGFSFAVFNYTFLGNVSVITAKDVELRFLESNSEVIAINNGLPMTDEDGMNQDKTGNVFDFEVRSKVGYDSDIKYDLVLEKLDVDAGLGQVSDSDVKVYIEDFNGNTVLEPTKVSDLKNYNLIEKTNHHSANKSIISNKYRLKVWLDKNYDIFTGKEMQYKFKIGVKVEQKNQDLNKQYTIIYNSNGGTGSMENTVFKVGSQGKLSKNVFIKTGYDFIGWSTKKGSSSVKYDDESVISDVSSFYDGKVKLYAVWKVSIYNVKVNVVNGKLSGESEKQVNYNESVKFDGVSASTGYDRPSISCTNGQSAVINGNVITTGKITKDTVCTVTYKANELKFDNQTVDRDYSDNVQSINLTGASNGTGSYTYQIVSGNSNNYFSINGLALSIKAGTSAGVYTLTVRAIDTKSNMTKDINVSITINRISPAIKSEDKTVDYTGSRIEYVATSNSSGGFIYEYYNDVGCVSSNKLADNPINAGLYSVKVKQVASGNYTSGEKCSSLTINKINNTVVVNGNSLTYTGGSQKLVRVSSNQGDVYYSVGTELTKSNYSTSGSTLIPEETNAGTYKVYYYVFGNNNYNAKSGSVDVVIAKSNTSTTLVSKATTVYTGSSVSSNTATSKLSSNNSLLSGDYTYEYYNGSSCSGTKLSNAPKNKGTYSVKAILTGTSNYNGSTSGCVNHVISAKDLTIIARDQTINQGDRILTSTSNVSVSGLVGYDSLTSIILTPSTNAVTTSGTITPSGAKIVDSDGNDVTSNYNISYKNGVLVINGIKYTVSLKKGTGVDKLSADYVTCTTSGTSSSCAIKLPTITSSSTYGPGFFGTSSSTIGSLSPGDTITVSSNKTYYALAKKMSISFVTENGSEVNSTYGWSNEKNVIATYSYRCGVNGVTCTFDSSEEGGMTDKTVSETLKNTDTYNNRFTHKGIVNASMTYNGSTVNNSISVVKVGYAATTLLNNGVVTSGSGLYQDAYEGTGGVRFIYRGTGPNNYFKVGSDSVMWRIVAIEPDGTLKIVRNENYTSAGTITWGSVSNFAGSGFATSGEAFNQKLYSDVPDGGNSKYTQVYHMVANKNWPCGTIPTVTPGNSMATTIAQERNTSTCNVLADGSGSSIGLLSISDFLRASSNSTCTSMAASRTSTSNCNNNWLTRSSDSVIPTMNASSDQSNYVVWKSENNMSGVPKTTKQYPKYAAYYQGITDLLSGSGTLSSPYLFRGY